MALHFLLLAAIGRIAPASWVLLPTSLVLSATAFLVYRADKRAAQAAQRLIEFEEEDRLVDLLIQHGDDVHLLEHLEARIGLGLGG